MTIQLDDVPAVEGAEFVVVGHDDLVQPLAFLDDLLAHHLSCGVGKAIETALIQAAALTGIVRVVTELVAEEIKGFARLLQIAVILVLIDNINRKAFRVKAHLAALGFCERNGSFFSAVVNVPHGQRGFFVCNGARNVGAFEADSDRTAAVRLKLRAVTAVNGDVIGMQNILPCHVGRLRLCITAHRHQTAQRHRDAVLRREREGLLAELLRSAEGVERYDG